MRFAKSFITLATLMTVACTTNEPASEAAVSGANLSAVEKQSCLAGDKFILPEKIAITATSVGWGEGAEKALTPLKPVSVFALSSENSRFGGLSGLDFLDQNTLLSVSDSGEFIWLDFDEGKPADAVYMSLLRGADGQPLQGKTEADSEGVAWNGSYAFVSFERDHRVLGYDIEGCGANARGIPVATFEPNGFVSGVEVKPNSGLESLTDFGDGLLSGLEMRVKGDVVITALKQGLSPDFSLKLPAPEITMLVGLEVITDEHGGGRIYALTRSYDPIRGNRIGIVTAHLSPSGEVSDAKILTTFGKEITVDNFEGIAARNLGDGTDRLFLISDDNFSPRQRTLLGILDYTY